MADLRGRVTQLLAAWRQGDQDALDALAPLIYEELRQLAHAYMRHERPGHLLQTTALVHEAYLRLVGSEVSWQDRHHFFALAARTMRRVLVDFARRRQVEEEAVGGAELRRLVLDGDSQHSADVLALDDALAKLKTFDDRKFRILELRFFGGLTIAETANVMTLSHATVERDFRLAKAWLAHELEVGA